MVISWQARISSVISEFFRLVSITLSLRGVHFGFRRLSSKQIACVSLCTLYVAGAFQQVLQSCFLLPALCSVQILKDFMVLNGDLLLTACIWYASS